MFVHFICIVFWNSKLITLAVKIIFCAKVKRLFNRKISIQLPTVTDWNARMYWLVRKIHRNVCETSFFTDPFARPQLCSIHSNPYRVPEPKKMYQDTYIQAMMSTIFLFSLKSCAKVFRYFFFFFFIRRKTTKLYIKIVFLFSDFRANWTFIFPSNEFKWLISVNIFICSNILNSFFSFFFPLKLSDVGRS